MTITPSLFEASLKCLTKCWLRFTGEPPTGNTYAEWVQTQHGSYRAEAAKRLIANAPADKCAIAPVAENLKTAKWPLAVDVPVRIEFRSSRAPQTPLARAGQKILTMNDFHRCWRVCILEGNEALIFILSFEEIRASLPRLLRFSL